MLLLLIWKSTDGLGLTAKAPNFAIASVAVSFVDPISNPRKVPAVIVWVSNSKKLNASWQPTSAVLNKIAPRNLDKLIFNVWGCPLYGTPRYNRILCTGVS